MRALDDIIIGFLIFFAIDRTITLFSKNVVQPWAESNSTDKNTIDNWKLGIELLCLVIAAYFIFRCRKTLQRFDNQR